MNTPEKCIKDQAVSSVPPAPPCVFVCHSKSVTAGLVSVKGSLVIDYFSRDNYHDSNKAE